MLQSCFGADAAHYPDPAAWAQRAVPLLLGIGPQGQRPADGGRRLSVPPGVND